MTIKPATALLALIVTTGHAFAQSSTCAGQPTLTRAEIGRLFLGAGQYTCGSYGGETFNELHVGSEGAGTITDYKKGPTDPIDPSKQIGTYAVDADGAVGILHDKYNGGKEYSYTISQNAATSYNYCGMNGAPALLSIKIQPAHC